MKIKININDMVKVKLTEYGKEIWARRNEELNAFIVARGGKKLIEGIESEKVRKDGTLRIQLWTLMQHFGKEMYMGNEAVFQNNSIEVDE